MLQVRRQLRSNDFDFLGHLNQSVYHVVLEDARLAFVAARLPLERFRFVIVRTELDHQAEVVIGNREVEIEIELDHIGTTSFSLRQRVLRLDGVVAAQGLAVFACWDPERRRARPLTDVERAALASTPHYAEGAVDRS